MTSCACLFQADSHAHANRYYFMSVDSSSRLLAGRGSSVYSSSSMATVEGLELGHLLGKGSFGSVYYGTWHGAPVAVKVG